MKISNESKVGILAAVGIALLFIGFNYLKGINIFHKGTDYFVEYNSAGGLLVGDPIIIDGFTVGRVKAVGLQEDQSGVNVVLNFTENVKLPADSEARIRGNLMGEKYVEILMGHSTEVAAPDSNLKGSIETDLANTISAEFKPISDKVKSMLSQMDTAITVLRNIFTDEVQQDLQKSMQSIKLTLESFNRSADRVNSIIINEEGAIDSIINDVSDITAYVNESENDIKSILSNLKSVTDSLNAVEWQSLAKEFELAAQNINIISQKINAGEGSLGKLVNDEELYLELTRSLQTLDSAVAKFAEDPTIRLKLFGK
ncbi:MAG: MCE family protein [Bacteroidetes bacterium]|nr:MCE family protein [Bacteroidota bacterium]MBK8345289.1 MCE family protein [Bacteroidota bacterium]